MILLPGQEDEAKRLYQNAQNDWRRIKDAKASIAEILTGSACNSNHRRK